MTLFVGLYESPTGGLVEDLTGKLLDARFSDGEHGFEAFSGFYPTTLDNAFRLWQYRGRGWLRVTWQGYTAWEGRVEDAEIDTQKGGILVAGFGAVRAFYDVPYVRAWSSTRTLDFRLAPETVTNHNPKMYSTDQKDRLFIGLTKNSVYAKNADAAFFYLSVPNGTSSLWTWMEFTYSYFVPANWTIRGLGTDTSFGNSVTSNITTAGSTGSGTFTWNLSASPRAFVGVQAFNSSGGAASYSGETGGSAGYIRLTNVRLTTSASPVYGDEIVRSIISGITLDNSAQIQNVTSLIANPGVDLYNQVYQETYPYEIMNNLAGLGGSAGSLWEWGVWEDRIPYFRQRSSAAQTWYVDAANLRLVGSVDTLQNSVYGVYRDGEGGKVRTAASDNLQSQGQYGLVRRGFVQSDTTNATEIGYYVTAALADRKDPRPQVSVEFDRLYDAVGGQYPLFMVRAGDTVVVRNLPPTLSTDIDRIRSFRLARKEYNIDDDTVTVQPENLPAQLDFLIARNALAER